MKTFKVDKNDDQDPFSSDSEQKIILSDQHVKVFLQYVKTPASRVHLYVSDIFCKF